METQHVFLAQDDTATVQMYPVAIRQSQRIAIALALQDRIPQSLIQSRSDVETPLRAFRGGPYRETQQHKNENE